MASLPQCTWVWASSRSWWWKGKPGMLQFHGITRSWTWLSDWPELNLNFKKQSLIFLERVSTREMVLFTLLRSTFSPFRILWDLLIFIDFVMNKLSSSFLFHISKLLFPDILFLFHFSIFSLKTTWSPSRSWSSSLPSSSLWYFYWLLTDIFQSQGYLWYYSSLFMRVYKEFYSTVGILESEYLRNNSCIIFVSLINILCLSALPA